MCRLNCGAALLGPRRAAEQPDLPDVWFHAEVSCNRGTDGEHEFFAERIVLRVRGRGSPRRGALKRGHTLAQPDYLVAQRLNGAEYLFQRCLVGCHGTCSCRQG